MMKKLTYCLYEDKSVTGFGPLSETRPAWEMFCGGFTFAQRFYKVFDNKEIMLSPRINLRGMIRENTEYKLFDADFDSEHILFINGQVSIDAESGRAMRESASDTVFLIDNYPVAYKLLKTSVNRIRWNNQGLLDVSSLRGLSTLPIGGKLFRYPWELVSSAEKMIREDLSMASRLDPERKFEIPEYLSVNNIENVEAGENITYSPGITIDSAADKVRIEAGVTIGPGVIIDSRSGPVWIDKEAEIQAGAMLIGPVYIGKNSIVRPGARLSGGVCLGPQCRVGGEVSSTIILGYSNKQHSGYLGSSYIGEWVNFGAATDNSDLKNNYKAVDVILNKEKINSRDLHVGVIVGDYCRTAIQTRLNSGTVVGVCCNLFGSDFPDKSVPAFTWFGADGNMEYRLDKALETVEMIMSRRQKVLTPAKREILESIFKLSQADRSEF